MFVFAFTQCQCALNRSYWLVNDLLTINTLIMPLHTKSKQFIPFTFNKLHHFEVVTVTCYCTLSRIIRAEITEIMSLVGERWRIRWTNELQFATWQYSDQSQFGELGHNHTKRKKMRNQNFSLILQRLDVKSKSNFLGSDIVFAFAFYQCKWA